MKRVKMKLPDFDETIETWEENVERMEDNGWVVVPVPRPIKKRKRVEKQEDKSNKEET